MPMLRLSPARRRPGPGHSRSISVSRCAAKRNPPRMRSAILTGNRPAAADRFDRVRRHRNESFDDRCSDIAKQAIFGHRSKVPAHNVAHCIVLALAVHRHRELGLVQRAASTGSHRMVRALGRNENRRRNFGARIIDPAISGPTFVVEPCHHTFLMRMWGPLTRAPGATPRTRLDDVSAGRQRTGFAEAVRCTISTQSTLIVSTGVHAGLDVCGCRHRYALPW